MARMRTGVLAAALLLGGVLTGCAASTGSTNGGSPVGSGTATSGLTPTPVPRPIQPPGSRPTGVWAPAGPCPPTFGELQSAMGPIHQGVAGPSSLEVPLGAQGALVCAYGPIGPASPPALAWQLQLDRAGAAALLTVVDAHVTPQTDLIGPVNCPMDKGSAALLRFSYPDRASQDVLVRLTGCQPAASNHGTTMFRPDIVKAVLALHR
jgi:hypothetical protein